MMRCIGWMPKEGLVIEGCRGIHLQWEGTEVLVDPARHSNRRSYVAKEWLHRRDGTRAIPTPIAFSRTRLAMKALVANEEPLVVRDHVLHRIPSADTRESTSTIERKPALDPRPKCHMDLRTLQQFSGGFKPVVLCSGRLRHGSTSKLALAASEIRMMHDMPSMLPFRETWSFRIASRAQDNRSHLNTIFYAIIPTFFPRKHAFLCSLTTHPEPGGWLFALLLRCGADHHVQSFAGQRGHCPSRQHLLQI